MLFPVVKVCQWWPRSVGQLPTETIDPLAIDLIEVPVKPRRTGEFVSGGKSPSETPLLPGPGLPAAILLNIAQYCSTSCDRILTVYLALARVNFAKKSLAIEPNRSTSCRWALNSAVIYLGKQRCRSSLEKLERFWRKNRTIGLKVRIESTSGLLA